MKALIRKAAVAQADMAEAVDAALSPQLEAERHGALSRLGARPYAR